jgi:hypothetical protein
MLDWLTVTGTPTRPTAFALALYTVNPNFATGAGGTEATGGSYARQAMTMDAGNGRITANATAYSFTVGTNVAAGTYTGFGVYSITSGGVFLGGADFAVDRVLSATGDKINFAIGAIDVTLPNA